MNEVAAELGAWLAAGERVAIATVVRVTGSAPRPAGATLIACAGARIAGSVSNGCVEAAVYEQAMAVLEAGRARLVNYGISDEFAFTVGLSCGGAIDVLVEPVGAFHREALDAIRNDRPVVLVRAIDPADRVGTVAILRDDQASGWPDELRPLEVPALAASVVGAPRLVQAPLADGREGTFFLEAIAAPRLLLIVGATHVGQALARLAKTLGFRVVVADPRASLANTDRFPDADEIVGAWPDDAIARIGPRASASIVLLAHDPKFDRPGLVAALRTPAGYVGAIGSRRTNEERFAWLRAQGFSDADLGRIHAPVGLDIGAQTAEETALAILAEVVAARSSRSGRSLSDASLALGR
ncbi:MAG TPA: XdhC/CoxI family protein [Candidatus Limnocylindria bacterium]|nr:XdhC/CoxI family protein [Candidatus Limnocylindria bacterium]